MVKGAIGRIGSDCNDLIRFGKINALACWLESGPPSSRIDWRFGVTTVGSLQPLVELKVLFLRFKESFYIYEISYTINWSNKIVERWQPWIAWLRIRCQCCQCWRLLAAHPELQRHSANSTLSLSMSSQQAKTNFRSVEPAKEGRIKWSSADIFSNGNFYALLVLTNCISTCGAEMFEARLMHWQTCDSVL